MAVDEEKILSIKVDYAEAIKAIGEYQTKIDELKIAEKDLEKQWKDGEISLEKYNEEMAASKIQTQQYKEAIRLLNKEVNNSLKSDKQKDTSLKGLRATLSSLTAEYDSLSREERNAAKGKELQKHINEITDELKGAEEGTQRFYRNVGNYMGSVKGAFGMARAAVVSFGQQLKVLMTNPFILAIAAIAAMINGIAKAIQSSEEQTNRWRIALAPLNAILDVLQNWLTQIAAKFLDLVEGAGRLLNWTMKLIGAEGWFAESMKEVNNAIVKRVDLEKQQQAIVKAERDEIVKTANREKQIAELRAKFAEKDKYNAQERLKFLDQAIALEIEQARVNKRLAEQRRDALMAEAELTDNDAEMNNKLEEAKAAVVRADTELFNKQRELNGQRAETIALIEAEKKAILEKGMAELKSKVQDMLGVSDKEFEQLLKPQEELTLAKLANAENWKEGMKKINAEMLEDERATTWKEIKIQEEKANAMRNITGSLIDLISAIGDENKAAAVAAKVIALAQIAIDTGVAISKAVATSAGKGFWGFLAEVGPFIATIVSNMATAIKTVKSAKFATGGDVTGEGTATSDSIPAMLSNGESVMTAKATSMFAPILSAFNQAGGGVPIYGQQMGNQAMGEDMLAKSFAKGLANMPAPVVSVEEISTVTNRVKVIENINRI